MVIGCPYFESLTSDAKPHNSIETTITELVFWTPDTVVKRTITKTRTASTLLLVHAMLCEMRRNNKLFSMIAK